MNHKKTLLFLSLAFFSTVTTARAQSVWVASGSQKVRPADAPGSAHAAALDAAGNEFEGFHVVAHGGAKGVSGLTATATDLKGPGGSTIGGGDVRVFREAFLNVSTPSNVAGATGAWPDAMIPAVDELFGEPRKAFPVDVAANQNQPIYVEYHVPAGAKAGLYQGSVHLAGNGFAADVPVSLTVRGFTLPSTSSLRSAFGFGWAEACAAHFGGYQMCGGDAGLVGLTKLYTQLALDHRISLEQSIYTGPQPLAAGGWDWATWDKDWAPLLDGTAPTRLKGAKLTAVRYAWDIHDSSKYAAWAQHFKARGWFDRTFDYTCDEPPAGCAWSDITARAATAHAGDPAFNTITTTTIAQAQSNGVLGALETLVPDLVVLTPRDTATTRPAYDGWLASPPHQIWWYQSCTTHGCFIEGGPDTVGWPSYMIDAPAMLNRAMEWYSWRNRVSGELYFDTTYAVSRGDGWANQYYFGGNGDGTLFYAGTPARIGGTHDIPIASLRMKMIREGMEDYEYLKALADAGDPKMADAEAAALAPTAQGFTLDAAKLDEARRRIAARIEQLKGTAPTPDAMTPSNPDGGSGANPGSDGTGSAASGDTGGVGGGAPDPAGAGNTSQGGCSSTGVAADHAGALSLLVSLSLALYLTLRRRFRR